MEDGDCAIICAFVECTHGHHLRFPIPAPIDFALVSRLHDVDIL